MKPPATWPPGHERSCPARPATATDSPAEQPGRENQATNPARPGRITGMPQFVPGLQLACEFHAEAVRPLLEEHFPQVQHAAGLLGPGSEVAGLDTERS